MEQFFDPNILGHATAVFVSAIVMYVGYFFTRKKQEFFGTVLAFAGAALFVTAFLTAYKSIHFSLWSGV